MLTPTAVDSSTEAKDQASPKITVSISGAPSESCTALPVWLETVLRRLESREDIPLLAVSVKSDTKQEVMLIRFCNSVTSTCRLPLTSTQTSVTVCCESSHSKPRHNHQKGKNKVPREACLNCAKTHATTTHSFLSLSLPITADRHH